MGLDTSHDCWSGSYAKNENDQPATIEAGSKFCLVGAILKTTNASEVNALALKLSLKWTDWNDHPKTTFNDVKKFLTQATKPKSQRIRGKMNPTKK